MQEIKFQKYRNRGAYHWEYIQNHPIKFNAYVVARYYTVIQICKNLVEETSNQKIKVLDLGCGDGVLSYLLWKEGFDVTGTDINKTAINYSKEKHSELHTNVNFSSADGYNTGLDDSSFDLTICADVIEHVACPEKLIYEANRVTKDGGYVIYSTPIKTTFKPIDDAHIQEYFSEELTAFLEEHYCKIDIHVSHPFIWYDLYIRNLFFKVLINIVSKIFYNPFYTNQGHKLYHMQYAICKIYDKNRIW
jgi:2-polyprenyl-3-methyl-5-hydroxy-6-metoxy-1,4-benzoquinol methylase